MSLTKAAFCGMKLATKRETVCFIIMIYFDIICMVYQSFLFFLVHVVTLLFFCWVLKWKIFMMIIKYQTKIWNLLKLTTLVIVLNACMFWPQPEFIKSLLLFRGIYIKKFFFINLCLWKRKNLNSYFLKEVSRILLSWNFCLDYILCDVFQLFNYLLRILFSYGIEFKSFIHFLLTLWGTHTYFSEF